MQANVDRPSNYSAVAKTLHWAIALLILVDFLLALYFARIAPRGDDYAQTAYEWHMSTGMWVLALSLVRILWRCLHRYPALPADMNQYSRLVAKCAHTLLYIYMIVVPLFGWVVLTLRRQPAHVLGDVNWPGVPYITTMTTREQRVAIYQALLPAHIVLAYAGLALIGLHVAAGLYHHYYRRDDVLRRMLPQFLSRPWSASDAQQHAPIP
jgi:cytochrome b561